MIRTVAIVVMMLIGLAAGCCVVPGHDVRQFFTGRVVSTKPPASSLVGSYVVSVDRREGVKTPASVTLQLNADGTTKITGDMSIFGFASPTGGGTGSWALVQRDADRVWCVEITVDLANESHVESWYVLQRDDGSYELGNFYDDPDSGHIVELKRSPNPTTAPN